MKHCFKKNSNDKYFIHSKPRIKTVFFIKHYVKPSTCSMPFSIYMYYLSVKIFIFPFFSPLPFWLCLIMIILCIISFNMFAMYALRNKEIEISYHSFIAQRTLEIFAICPRFQLAYLLTSSNNEWRHIYSRSN